MYRIGNQRNYWSVSTTRADLRRERRPPHELSIPAEPQQIAFDLQHTAILVVDMQNDFCSKNGWLDYIGADYRALQQPIDPLNRALPVLREAGVPVVWLNWGNRPDRMNLSPSVLHVYNMTGEGIGIGEPLPNNQSRLLEKGSWGAAIVSALQTEPSDIYVDKYRMSGFWDTPLDSILRNLHIHTILFAGVNLDQCVMATLQDAVNAGYDSILLEDCCATNSPAYCTDATLYNIKQCYGFVSTSTAVLEALQR